MKRILIIWISLTITFISGANAMEECMKEKTNFMYASTSKGDEKKALIEIGTYLISIGKYPNEKAMEKDAKERVVFFEALGLYSQDPQLANASQYRKQIHALIYAHELHDVIVSNNGYLPCNSQ